MPKRSQKGQIENALHLARLAVEFSYQVWYAEHAELFPRPASGVYWTVRLGRLALQRNGTWAYHSFLGRDAEKESVDLVRAQRFETFDEAVRAATAMFKQEPEHAAELRVQVPKFCGLE